MVLALYTLFWGLAVVGMAINTVILPVVGVVGCILVIFYVMHGYNKNPRSPRGLWLERDAGVPDG
jgi:hypothetical protein